MAKRRGAKRSPLANVLRGDGRTLIVAMDHGAFMGAAQGWENPEPVIRAVLEGGADAIMATFGIIKQYRLLLHRRAGVIFSSPLVASEMQRSAEVAKELGADCLKIFVGVGSDEEASNLNALWSSSLACHRTKIPLLAEMFPFKGPKIENPTDTEVIKKYSRIAAEYGADMVKTFYTGSEDSFRQVISSCPVPVVILGGERMDTDLDLLSVVEGSIRAGGSGVAIGRNIWQHKNPRRITRAVSRVIHEGYTAAEASREV
jgi:DhnA family fructose-bisphosphate aldolase class Ia